LKKGKKFKGSSTPAKIKLF
jgi:hypothetical protein